MAEERWDFRCGECGWTGLVDECFYECDSKDMELWSDSDEFKG
jgi:hypothetical protein